jgi:copper chaperone CopZ
MVCDKMCPPKVETALGAVEGVAKVEVTYPDTAKVFGNDATCSEEGQPTLLKALEAAGFGGAVLNAS